jgi:hypothetical protein
MLRSIIFVLFFVLATTANAVSIQKQPQESDTAFANRYVPDGASESVHVASAMVWGLKKPVIVAFYEDATGSNGAAPGEVYILGVMFIPINSTEYKQFTIDSYGPAGVTAEIRSVFFAKTDKTSEAKLFVMVSWPNHSGTLYDTLIYEKPKLNSGEDYLTPFKKFGEMFLGCDFCVNSDKPDSPAKYRNAADVKAKLKQLIK